MATIKKIYLSQFNSVQQKARGSGNTYTISYSNPTFGVQYIPSDTDGFFTRYRTYLAYLANDASKELIGDNIKIKKIIIYPLNITAQSGNTYTRDFTVASLNTEIGSNGESKFTNADAALRDNMIGNIQPNTSGAYVGPEFDVTDETAINNILQYGIVIGSRVTGLDASTAMFVATTSVELDVEYDDSSTPPQVNITSPSYYDAVYTKIPMTESLDIKWEYSQPVGILQSGFEIISKYAPYDSNDYISLTGLINGSDTEYLLTPEQYPIIPQNPSLDQNLIYARQICIWVKAYSSNNSISSELLDTSEYGGRKILFSFPKPSDLTPNNYEYMMANEIIHLKWTIKFLNTSGNEIESNILPSNFDIEYSDNAGETWKTLVSNGIIGHDDNNIFVYDVPANTFKNGIIEYRIRAYVGGKTIDAYETGYITIRVQASTSSVTCDGKPMPTLSWQSSAQVAYQVRFADYDSGAIYGTDTSHTIPYFYADGNYPVQVRTQASNGEWSDWTELEYVAITNSAPSNQIGLTITPTRHAVVADWTDSGVSDNYILYRNGIPIYIGDDKNYTDIAANGKCTYFVRAVAGKYYSQSNAVTVSAYPRVDCIYDFSGVTWIPLKFSLSPRSRIYSKSTNVVYNHYAGRDKPIAFTAGHNTRQMSGNYIFKTRDDALRISDLSGKRVVFKDTRGGIIIGILNNVNINVESKLYPVTFTITETDYKETVEYAAT